MKILIAFASKHGSTKGIAEFIGATLRKRGMAVDVLDVGEAKNVERYDAFVLGSALYMGHWMKEAKQFLARNKSVMSSHPTWLFSSGPTGKERKDAKGRDLLAPSVSGPFELDELRGQLGMIRDHQIFFGAFDPKDLDFFS